MSRVLVAHHEPIEDDPNLTNKRFRGNPTKSFRSREPLRVISEIEDWVGHSPEAVANMNGFNLNTRPPAGMVVKLPQEVIPEV